MINPLLVCSSCRWDRHIDCDLLGCQCVHPSHKDQEDES